MRGLISSSTAFAWPQGRPWHGPGNFSSVVWASSRKARLLLLRASADRALKASVAAAAPSSKEPVFLLSPALFLQLCFQFRYFFCLLYVLVLRRSISPAWFVRTCPQPAELKSPPDPLLENCTLKPTPTLDFITCWSLPRSTKRQPILLSKSPPLDIAIRPSCFHPTLLIILN